jgi:hypothetical protein
MLQFMPFLLILSPNKSGNGTPNNEFGLGFLIAALVLRCICLCRFSYLHMGVQGQTK